MKQQELNIHTNETAKTVGDYEFEPIRGQPMLRWAGKRPFTATQFYPAQEKERHGDEVNGWMNRIYWGDNLQVMSHLLKEFRGKVDLIYIDPPFDSKADYKKKIDLRGKKVENDHTSFEDKQYTDIWTNDEYLQFMYERIVLIRELLSNKGTAFVHCDFHKSHYIRMILDEVFGAENFRNEIVWKRRGGALNNYNSLGSVTDTIFFYSKSSAYTFNSIRTKDTPEAQEYIKQRFVYDDGDGRKYSRDPITNPSQTPTPSLIYTYKGYQPPAKGWAFSRQTMEEWDAAGKLYFPDDKTQRIRRKTFLSDYEGHPIQNLWADIYVINSQAKEATQYPTQKPEALLDRIMKLASNPGDIVFDCFMGSGTTQAVAMKLGRRFIGADINLGSIQTTTKRLIHVAKDLGGQLPDAKEPKYTGFTVYNVNNYDVFRNPVEARDLLVQALELQPLPKNGLYDGEKDGAFYKIMPVNRLATKADLNEIVMNFDYKLAEKRQNENPGQPVLTLKLVCMGHEPDLKPSLEAQLKPFKVDVEVVDILRDKSNLVFKRDSEADIVVKGKKLTIKAFYPMNLLKKLSLQKSKVGDWKELVESVMIDFNYDGAVFTPTVVDVPEGDAFVKGEYDIPEGAGTIKVKITDLLSESLEAEVK